VQLGYDNSERELTATQRAEYLAEGRQPALRLRVPDQEISFVDLVRGPIAFPAGSFPDFVLVRPGGQPLYTLVNPVDDALMGVTHVLRGEDLLSSTPRQVALYNAMHQVGLASHLPRFGHLPFVMGEGNAKLSKRNPESNLFLHRDRGFIPEGLLNYLALLGWSIAPDRDIFTLDELAASFDVTAVNPNPARFDQKKADAINAAHIRLLDDGDLAKRLVPYLQSAGVLPADPSAEQLKLLNSATPLIRERITMLSEAVGMLSFLFLPAERIHFEPEALASLSADSATVIGAAIAALESVQDFAASSIEVALQSALITELQLKPREAYAPLRVAISGRRVSPPLFESMELLGKAETLERLSAFQLGH
jgi:glutamyl-tRNA synthetase